MVQRGVVERLRPLGLAVPAGTPRPVAERLNALANEAVELARLMGQFTIGQDNDRPAVRTTPAPAPPTAPAPAQP